MFLLSCDSFDKHACQAGPRLTLNPMKSFTSENSCSGGKDVQLQEGQDMNEGRPQVVGQVVMRPDVGCFLMLFVLSVYAPYLRS